MLMCSFVSHGEYIQQSWEDKMVERVRNVIKRDRKKGVVVLSLKAQKGTGFLLKPGKGIHCYEDIPLVPSSPKIVPAPSPIYLP